MTRLAAVATRRRTSLLATGPCPRHARLTRRATGRSRTIRRKTVVRLWRSQRLNPRRAKSATWAMSAEVEAPGTLGTKRTTPPPRRTAAASGSRASSTPPGPEPA